MKWLSRPAFAGCICNHQCFCSRATRDKVDHDQFTSTAFLPCIGAISCAFFVGPWTGRDSIEYLFAGALLAVGIVLWASTLVYMKSKGEDVSHDDMSNLKQS